MNAASRPLVSVVIPTYNHAGFLREALESLVAQTFSDWEALVVNNYSEDGTLDVIEAFNDPRIRVDNFRNNGVIGASRNRGIRLSQGKYIAFLDSDDKWYPEKLSHCVCYLDQGADLVCHDLRSIGTREGIVHCGPKQRATFDALLERGSCIIPSATLVRKSILDSVGGFSENPAFITSEDYHLWIKLAQTQAIMVFIEEILGEYRVHAGNQSGSVLFHMNSALSVIDDFLQTDSSSSLKSRLRARRCKALIYYGAGRSLQTSGQYAEAWQLFLISFELWPLNTRIYGAIGLNCIAWVRVKCRLLALGVC